MNNNNNLNNLNNINNNNNFYSYYTQTRGIYTNCPLPESIFNKSILNEDGVNEDGENKDVSRNINLIEFDNIYYTELQFYRKTFDTFYKLIKKNEDECQKNIELDNQNTDKYRLINKLKNEFGDLYDNVLSIANEYSVSQENIIEYLELPLPTEYKKYKRNITKKYNKLEAMSNLDKKNKDQINSLLNFNLVKFKKKWIEKKS